MVTIRIIRNKKNVNLKLLFLKRVEKSTIKEISNTNPQMGTKKISLFLLGLIALNSKSNKVVNKNIIAAVVNPSL